MLITQKMLRKLVKNLYKRRKKRIFRSYVLKGKYGYSSLRKLRIFCRKQGFSIDDYYVYQLDKNNYDDYLSTIDSYLPHFANSTYLKCVSDNKLIFPYFFGKYFNVVDNLAVVYDSRIIELNHSGLNNSTFVSILENNDLILKPFNGCDGGGVFLLSFSKGEYLLNNSRIDETELLKFIKTKNNYIIQKKLTNHSYVRNIFPDSLNTIRIVSAKDSSNHTKIFGAIQRIGTIESAPADNFSRKGLSVDIENDTGILRKGTKYGSFMNGERVFYSKHPDTNQMFDGVKIPFWDEIKKSILNFCSSFPLFEYIAWDIAICDDGKFYVLETNMKSSLDVFQVHGGIKNTEFGKIYRNMAEKYKNEI